MTVTSTQHTSAAPRTPGVPAPPERAPAGPLTREAAEALAATLVGEMIQRWRQGERPLPEEYLARHPELREHPVAAADLIYEELCLRQEYGPEVPVEQVLARFPQWRPQLEVLFDCQRLLGPSRPAPQFPEAGESLGDFLLLAELGRGAHGRVFLASQLSLGDRPVVLKVTPGEAHEHLSLARLQHTHIVPLYSVQDHPARGLRALCMPYFGGATLAQLLEALRPRPLDRRTGQDLLDALDQVQAAAPLIAPARKPARQAWAGATYADAVCWLGACLADALHYAHERGLVHLDLKPSNVLLAADGQPMVLDFHLAREPIHPDGPEPIWLGGTAGYMSPEQQAALRAAQQGRRVPRPVDGRSDVYSLGVVLYEALAGSLPFSAEGQARTASTVEAGKAGAGSDPAAPRTAPRPLDRSNAQVSVGLADIVARCLAADPDARYPDMAALAADLRRHLAHRPLVGVRNRSLAERWRKWRRRRPHGAALTGMMLAVLTATSAVTLGAILHVGERVQRARTALGDAQIQMAKGEWDLAAGTLGHGLSAVRGLPGQHELAEALEHRLAQARQGKAAADRAALARQVNRLADRARFLYGAEYLSSDSLRDVAASCRAFWDHRARVVRRLSPDGSRRLDPEVHDDLLDLAIFWADLQVRLAPPAENEAARRTALAVLDQAEELFGPSPVLDQERRLHGESRRAAPGQAPRTAWEHYALGRALLRSGDLEAAADELGRAVRLRPQGLWPNYYQGVCAYRRGRPLDAAAAFSVCVGAAPEAAGGYFHRALAWEALGRPDAALRDYDQALALDPALAAAAHNRGLLHLRARRSAAALESALVHWACGQYDAARDDLLRLLGR